MKKILILFFSIVLAQVSKASQCPAFAKKYNCDKQSFSNKLVIEFMEIKTNLNSAEVIFHLFGEYTKNGKIYNGPHMVNTKYLFGHQVEKSNEITFETNSFCDQTSLNIAQIITIHMLNDMMTYRNSVYSITSAGNMRFIESFIDNTGRESNLSFECRKM